MLTFKEACQLRFGKRQNKAAAAAIGVSPITVSRYNSSAVVIDGVIYTPTGYELPQVTYDERRERLQELLRLPFTGRRQLAEVGGYGGGDQRRGLLYVRYYLGLPDHFAYRWETYDEWRGLLKDYL